MFAYIQVINYHCKHALPPWVIVSSDNGPSPVRHQTINYLWITNLRAHKPIYTFFDRFEQFQLRIDTQYENVIYGLQQVSVCISSLITATPFKVHQYHKLQNLMERTLISWCLINQTVSFMFVSIVQLWASIIATIFCSPRFLSTIAFGC